MISGGFLQGSCLLCFSIGAWQYPDQQMKWTLVHLGKISSWFLLVIISFVIVAQLKHVKEALNGVRVQSSKTKQDFIDK